MSDTYTCPDPFCKAVSYNPNDIKFQWCGKCKTFGWAMNATPVYFDSAIATLQSKVRRALGSGAPFSLQLEQFTGANGSLKWRALVKIGSAVWKHSRKEHPTPTDALTELIQLAEVSHG